jgi:hypothetical protein
MWKRILVVLILVTLAAGAMAAKKRGKVIQADDVDQWTVAWWSGGPGSKGFVQGPRSECSLGGNIVFDSKGDAYVTAGTCIATIPKEGTVRIITGTPGVKGCTDGPPWKTTFGSVSCLDIHNDVLYVLDRSNLAVRKVEQKDGKWITTTIAGGPGKKDFKPPFDGMAVDENGIVYVMTGDYLKKIENGKVITMNAGSGRDDGPIAKARFRKAMGGGHSLTYDGKGNLYMADRWNQALRKIDLKKGEVSTVAGVLPGEKWWGPHDGPAFEARFHPGGGPCSAHYNRKYDFILVKAADEGSRIRIVRDGSVKTFGGWSKKGKTFVGPLKDINGGGISGIDKDGNIYLSGGGGIRVIRRKGGAE